MTTVELITALFYEVDEQLRVIPKHPEAHLWPSEVVTLAAPRPQRRGQPCLLSLIVARLSAIVSSAPRAHPALSSFKTHQDWTRAFLGRPDRTRGHRTYGIELIHPMREGRSPQQIGRKGLSNHRWIVGGKLCLLLNQWGLIVGWACATANVADNAFQWLIRQFEERMIVLSDTGFHGVEGDPPI